MSEKPKGILVMGDLHVPSSEDIQAFIDLANQQINSIKGNGNWYHGSPTRWAKGYTIMPLFDNPDCDFRTIKEVNVAHKTVQRLDFEGGKALWKSKHNRKREWVRFTYDNDIKQITVDNGRKVNLRGPVVEEYERYLARLVCT